MAALSRLTSADADEDAGNGGTTRSSQLTPAPSAEKPTVNALDEITALVDDKLTTESAFYFDMARCRRLSTQQWRAMLVVTGIQLYEATDPSRFPKDVELPKHKGSVSDHVRGFNPSHLEQYSWLAYSHTDNGVYCRVCCVFLSLVGPPHLHPPGCLSRRRTRLGRMRVVTTLRTN